MPVRAGRLVQMGAFYRGEYKGEQVSGPIVDGEWARIVADVDSFSFCPYPNVAKNGVMTCRREYRKTGSFWYAYRKANYKMQKIYIGKDASALDPFLLKSIFEILTTRLSEEDDTA